MMRLAEDPKEEDIQTQYFSEPSVSAHPTQWRTDHNAVNVFLAIKGSF